MMHGHEKSDSVIVAVKPANKAVHPAAEQSAAEAFAAEPGGPRAETKGNADQQTMPWAQSQTSMPRALDRIREVARERKKEKFISLFHHISIDLLAEAFYQLEVDAAPGVDRLMWKDYEAELERNLEVHYVLDLWAVRWRRCKATGDMIIVRYADDFIVGFQHERDARWLSWTRCV